MCTAFLLVALVFVIVLIWWLNRRLHAAFKSNRLNTRKIGWLFAGVVAACAAMGVVLQLLADLHGLD